VIGGGDAWSDEAMANALALSNERAPTDQERAAAEPHATDDVVAWNPATGSWRALPPAPVARASFGETVLWTGTELLVLPGDTSYVSTADPPLLLLDPAAGRWRVGDPPTGGIPFGSAAAWTGHELFLFGGGGGSCCPPSTRGLTFTP
jgi:hypothetical protein